MVTTIQIKETTRQALNRIKFKEKAESYDEIIQSLIESKMKSKEMFGFTKKKPLSFKKEDEMSFNEI